ncbi:MAG: alpha/beta hydrolase [Deltaproteobacteria bacterium]|nr:alpha/beta hydrolase [Deltaproteobacteria bacterium]
MHYLEKDSVRIYYETHGKGGDWVTLVNGYTRPCSDFRMMSSLLVKEGMRVLVFDNRGAGKTECPGEFSLQDIVEDIVDLWKVLGVTQSHVVGISMGGGIAQMLALRTEENLKSLCLISTSARLPELQGRAEWPKDEAGVTHRLETYFHPTFVERNKLVIQAMARQIAKKNLDGTFSRNANAQRKAIKNAHIDLEKLRHVKVPTLIIHGAEDHITPISEAQFLHELIQGSHLHTFPKAAHLLLAERSKELYQVVTEFVSS